MKVSPGLLEEFAASRKKYALSVVGSAAKYGYDVPAARLRHLGELRDTYTRWRAENQGPALNFVAYYQSYARAAVDSGKLPTDLQDDFKTWYDARIATQRAKIIPEVRQSSQVVAELVGRVLPDMALAYYDRMTAEIAAYEAEMTAVLRAARWTESKTPQGAPAGIEKTFRQVTPERFLQPVGKNLVVMRHRTGELSVAVVDHANRVITRRRLDS